MKIEFSDGFNSIRFGKSSDNSQFQCSFMLLQSEWISIFYTYLRYDIHYSHFGKMRSFFITIDLLNISSIFTTDTNLNTFVTTIRNNDNIKETVHQPTLTHAHPDIMSLISIHFVRQTCDMVNCEGVEWKGQKNGLETLQRFF